jgi:hypothetical protein
MVGQARVGNGRVTDATPDFWLEDPRHAVTAPELDALADRDA